MRLGERYGNISVVVSDHVAVLEISNPPNNHVSMQIIKDLAEAFEAADSDTDCRCLVLASAGKVFCAGADLTGANAGAGADAFYKEAVRLFANKKPIVAAVQGAAVGAGLGLALVADFRVAAQEARFSANFVKLGFYPGFGLTHTLAQLVGKQRSATMILTGRRIKADEALEWGLADALAPFEEVRAQAIRLARELAQNAPLSVQASRATLRAKELPHDH